MTADDDAGAAYAFRRTGGTWAQEAKLNASDAVAEDEFGTSVAAFGETVVSGTPWHSLGAAVQAGAAYAFLLEAPAPAPSPSPSPTPSPTAKPAISRLTPATGRRGATVLMGTAFGAKRGTSCVKFGARKCTRYLSWSATRIKCKVPAKAAFGSQKVKVTTTAGVSKAKRFRVKR